MFRHVMLVTAALFLCLGQGDSAYGAKPNSCAIDFRIMAGKPDALSSRMDAFGDLHPARVQKVLGYIAEHPALEAIDAKLKGQGYTLSGVQVDHLGTNARGVGGTIDRFSYLKHYTSPQSADTTTVAGKLSVTRGSEGKSDFSLFQPPSVKSARADESKMEDMPRPVAGDPEATKAMQDRLPPLSEDDKSRIGDEVAQRQSGVTPLPRATRGNPSDVARVQDRLPKVSPAEGSEAFRRSQASRERLEERTGGRTAPATRIIASTSSAPPIVASSDASQPIIVVNAGAGVLGSPTPKVKKTTAAAKPAKKTAAARGAKKAGTQSAEKPKKKRALASSNDKVKKTASPKKPKATPLSKSATQLVEIADVANGRADIQDYDPAAFDLESAKASAKQSLSRYKSRGTSFRFVTGVNQALAEMKTAIPKLLGDDSDGVPELVEALIKAGKVQEIVHYGLDVAGEDYYSKPYQWDIYLNDGSPQGKRVRILYETGM